MNEESIYTNLLLSEVDELLGTVNTREFFSDNRIFVEKLSPTIRDYINKIFPSLTEGEILNLLKLLYLSRNFYTQDTDKIEVVGTFPALSKIRARHTVSVIKEIIQQATENILITGYSISEYSREIFESILRKSQRGIHVEIYINDDQNVSESLERFNCRPGKYLKIYRYMKKDEKEFSALHAKVIVVDKRRAFISSSNLSYNGIINNIELGTLIKTKKAASIHKIFEVLTETGYFVEL